MKLRISPDLALPREAVTETFAILAVRGAGKTTTATDMAEEMLKIGQPICVYDPTGAWYGLKSSADGKKAGFPVVIFGGEHADLPLSESSGDLIARVIVEKRIPVILDCSLLRKGERIRLMSDFCETLYHLNREPLHFFVDEAHTIAPQRLFPEVTRVLGAMEDILLQGRRRGLGATIISQRPALVNKNLLSMCSVMVAMRIVGPQDRDAINEWIDVHADKAQAKEVLASLPGLARGEGWVWSPGWLNLIKRVNFRARETFDSSATPEVGKSVITPKAIAEVDLKVLGEEITASIERAKADDPKVLRRHIAELEKQLAARPTEQVKVEVPVEVPILSNGHLEALGAAIGSIIMQAGTLSEIADGIRLELSRVQNRPPIAQPRSVQRTDSKAPSTPRTPPPPPRIDADSAITRAHQKILDALARLESLGIDRPSRQVVGALSGYSPSGGGFNNYLGRLRSGGLIDYPAGGCVALTDAGRSQAAPVSSPPTLAELHQAWFSIVGPAKTKILQAVIDVGPDYELHREEVAERTGYTVTGGGFNNYLGSLRTLGLIDYPRSGFVCATDLLFPEGLR